MQVETRVYCPLSQMQTFWYRRLLLKDSTLLKKIEADFKAEGGKVLLLSNFGFCTVVHLIVIPLIAISIIPDASASFYGDPSAVMSPG